MLRASWTRLGLQCRDLVAHSVLHRWHYVPTRHIQTLLLRTPCGSCTPHCNARATCICFLSCMPFFCAMHGLMPSTNAEQRDCAESSLLERPRAMMLLTYQYDAPPFRIPVAATGGPMSQALSRGLELWQVPNLPALMVLQ